MLRLTKQLKWPHRTFLPQMTLKTFELLPFSVPNAAPSFRLLSSLVTVFDIPGKEYPWDLQSPQLPHQHLVLGELDFLSFPASLYLWPGSQGY